MDNTNTACENCQKQKQTNPEIAKIACREMLLLRNQGLKMSQMYPIIK